MTTPLHGTDETDASPLWFAAWCSLLKLRETKHGE